MSDEASSYVTCDTVIGSVVPKILKDGSIFVCRVRKSKNIFLGPPDAEGSGICKTFKDTIQRLKQISIVNSTTIGSSTLACYI